LGKKLKYKLHFRKSSFKKDRDSGEIFLNLINQNKPKVFLEVGVLEGVTSRNVCDLLYKIYGNTFRYIGIDLFGLDIEENNKKEFTPISNKYSNLFKKIYFKYILKHKPNSVEGVKYLLKKYQNYIELHKGYSNNILKRLDLSIVDFCFLDGGHAYETVKNDLAIILSKIKKKSIILIDDYNQSNYGVKKAVDEIKNNYYYELLGRFILIRNN
jgi:hypothetical protein